MAVEPAPPVPPNPADPAAPPPPAPAGDPPAPAEDDLDFSGMDLDDLSAAIESAVAEGVKKAQPPAPVADPLEGVADDVRPFAERTLKLEKELAELRAKDAERETAASDAAKIQQIRDTAKEFRMSKEEVIAVGKYADEHPDVAAVLDFRTLAVVAKPDLLARSRSTPAPQPSAAPAAPAGGPAPAALVEPGSGGETPPKDWTPGAGHGFGDITRWALQNMGGTLMTEQP